VAADGGIFTFGNAPFYGSTGAMRLNRPVVGMAANPHGGGYWLVASDGGIFTFGSVPFWGSTGSQRLLFPIIAMAATTKGFPYLQGATGYDISWPQCGGAYPPPVPITVVGVNGGLSHNSFGNDISRNPCLVSEAAWAGPNLTVYVNTDGVPNGDPPSAASGPAGVCARSDLLCQGYNWGWDGAVRSVGYAHAVGLFPTVWWLDVEGPCGFALQLWRCDSLASNARVIQGAIDGLRASGMIAGIYSTFFQFPRVAGTGYAPGTPIWIPGATTVTDAASRCGNTSFWFGGGTPWLIQYGYGNGPPVRWDPDYACPQG
jgi:hypothetical protein